MVVFTHLLNLMPILTNHRRLQMYAFIKRLALKPVSFNEKGLNAYPGLLHVYVFVYLCIVLIISTMCILLQAHTMATEFHQHVLRSINEVYLQKHNCFYMLCYHVFIVLAVFVYLLILINQNKPTAV